MVSFIPQSTTVLYYKVELNLLKQKGKEYPWPRPPRCPCCGHHRLWGHGYVERYFDGHNYPFWVKRYLCPHCKRVHTLRPAQYHRRFHSRWVLIFWSLGIKIVLGTWMKDIPRQSQQYWWRGFIKQAQRHSHGVETELLVELLKLYFRQILFATHSVNYYEIRSYSVPPHLSFAFTPPDGFG